MEGKQSLPVEVVNALHIVGMNRSGMRKTRNTKNPIKGKNTQIRKQLRQRLEILAELKAGMSKTPIEKLRLIMGIKE